MGVGWVAAAVALSLAPSGGCHSATFRKMGKVKSEK